MLLCHTADKMKLFAVLVIYCTIDLIGAHIIDVKEETALETGERPRRQCCSSRCSKCSSTCSPCSPSNLCRTGTNDRVEFLDKIRDDCLNSVYGLNLTYSPSGRVYHFTANESTWNNAYLYCRRKGMNLVTLDSENKEKELEQLIKDNGLLCSTPLWIGLMGYACTTCDNWVGAGISVSDTGYTNWLNNGPDRGNGNKVCGALKLKDPDCGKVDYVLGWSYEDCTEERLVICELSSPCDALIDDKWNC